MSFDTTCRRNKFLALSLVLVAAAQSAHHVVVEAAATGSGGATTTTSSIPPPPPRANGGGVVRPPPPPRVMPPQNQGSAIIGADLKTTVEDDDSSKHKESSGYFPPPRKEKHKASDHAVKVPGTITSAKPMSQAIKPLVADSITRKDDVDDSNHNDNVRLLNPLSRPDPPANRPPPPPRVPFLSNRNSNNNRNTNVMGKATVLRPPPASLQPPPPRASDRRSTRSTNATPEPQWLDQQQRRHGQQQHTQQQQHSQQHRRQQPPSPPAGYDRLVEAGRPHPPLQQQHHHPRPNWSHPQQEQQQQHPLNNNHRRGPPPPQRQQGPPQNQRQHQHHSVGGGQLVARTTASAQQKQPPAWKRVWRGIERGLDSLADLEESVTERATKLVSERVPKQLPLSSKKFNTMIWGGNNKNSRQPRETTDSSSAAVTGSTATVTKASQQQQQPPPVIQDGIEGLVQRKMAASRFEKKAAGGSAGTANNNINAVELMTRTRPAVAGGWNHDTKRVIQAKGGALSESETALASSLPSDARQQQVGGEAGKTTNSSVNPLPHSLMTLNGDQQTDSNTIRNDARAFLNSQSSANQRPAGQPQQQHSTSAAAALQPTLNFDDDDDSVSLTSRIGSYLPRLPTFRLKFGRGYSGSYSPGVDMWGDDEETKSSRGFLSGIFGRKKDDDDDDADQTIPSFASSRSTRAKQSKSATPLIDNLLSRCDGGKTASLLTANDENASVSIGRSQGAVDLARLFLILAGARTIPNLHTLTFPESPLDCLFETAPAIFERLPAAFQTWSPFCFIAAVLLDRTSALVYEHRLKQLASSSNAQVRAEAEYGSMFLRLFSSEPTSSRLVPLAGNAAEQQMLAKAQSARIRMFVVCLLTSLVVMTVSSVGPLLLAVSGAFGEILGSSAFRSRPLEWELMGAKLVSVVRGVGSTASSLMLNELVAATENPLRVAFQASVFLALCTIAFIPALETKRKTHHIELLDEEEAEVMAHERWTGHLSDIGSSGANRLGLLSVDHSIESLLERWRAAAPSALSSWTTAMSIRSFGRLVVYGCLAGGVLAIPMLVYGSAGALPTFGQANAIINWDSLFEVSIVLFFSYRLCWNALTQIVRAEDMKQYVAGFLTMVKRTADERATAVSGGSVNLQLQASISPSAGLFVKDLWAAHTTKRAWAVRGAGLFCRNGEVLAVLGESGSGKSRLLTTLAEAMLDAPKSSLSATRVRGTISVGGVDVSKWDQLQLRKRVGLMLSDVRAIADTARVVSGRTLEEILEPSDGIQNFDPSHSAGPNERACVLLALKITGLNSSLLPKLPSKMASVVTCHEEDLKPSPLRPRYNVLSPTEWSKLILAKLLAQAIYDNENSAGTNDAVEQSLMGSVLLLDDPASHLSEVDETRLLDNFRKSGAATVLSSNRWATGRYADRIAVVKDGAVVESGTHEELLSRGPQQSLYAAQWHAMTIH